MCAFWFVANCRVVNDLECPMSFGFRPSSWSCTKEWPRESSSNSEADFYDSSVESLRRLDVRCSETAPCTSASSLYFFLDWGLTEDLWESFPTLRFDFFSALFTFSTLFNCFSVLRLLYYMDWRLLALDRELASIYEGATIESCGPKVTDSCFQFLM